MSNEEILITLYRAGSIGSKNPPKLFINVSEQICDFVSLDHARKLYAMQAEILAESLLQSLPGGTVDALLVELLRRKASLFSVPFYPDRKTETCGKLTDGKPCQMPKGSKCPDCGVSLHDFKGD